MSNPKCIPGIKCLIILCFWVELFKGVDSDAQEIKVSIPLSGKKCCFCEKQK